jgi:hypothetical protein
VFVVVARSAVECYRSSSHSHLEDASSWPDARYPWDDSFVVGSNSNSAGRWLDPLLKCCLRDELLEDDDEDCHS